MPVPIRAYNSSKTDSADYRLAHTLNNQVFNVDVNFDVAEIKIDPDYWLISKTDKILSVDKLSQSEEIKVYPNPYSESFTIQIPAGEELVTVELFDLQGKFVQKYIGNNTIFLWNDIPKGLYVLKGQTNLRSFETKLVKQ